MTDTFRVYVDFNSRTPTDRVVLNPTGSLREIQAHFGPNLVIGTRLTLYDEELEVDALLSYDEQCEKWVAVPIWATRRDRPDTLDSSS